ncbi:MAG: hypothetical protein GY795_11570, partial [Desulfobacterales bacterium]|nr:hypothetical protein [Desulfobacterales bacterium]
DDGIYSVTVYDGWSGSISPSKTDYTFNPEKIDFRNIDSQLENQNFEGAVLEEFIISGVISTKGSTPMADVWVRENFTDSNGYYEIILKEGWRGSVAPLLYMKTGRAIFAPRSRKYSNLSENKTGENFTCQCYAISGYIRSKTGDGVAGVTLNGLPGSPVTDAEGFFTAYTDLSWSGTVTPEKEGYLFEPQSLSYDSLSGDSAGQNFSATAVVTISGNITSAGAESDIENVSIWTSDGISVFSDENGYFSIQVEKGWTGVVGADKEGYISCPFVRRYENIETDHISQNFLIFQWRYPTRSGDSEYELCSFLKN